MKPNDIARVQDYLRRTFSNNNLTVIAPSKRGGPVEVMIGDEFIGVLHRDDEDGEVSYSLMITILDIDLPPVAPVPGKSK